MFGRGVGVVHGVWGGMITYGLRCACVFAFRVAAFSFGPNFGQFYDAVFTSKPFCHVVLLNEVAAAL